MLAQCRGGACFCTRGAMLGYDVVLFILALAKTHATAMLRQHAHTAKRYAPFNNIII